MYMYNIDIRFNYYEITKFLYLKTEQRIENQQKYIILVY